MKLSLKLSLWLCMLLGCVFPTCAEETYRSVVVTTASGNVIKFDLSGGVNVAFSDTEVIITSDNSEVKLPVTDFARFDFSDDASVNDKTIQSVTVIVGNDFINLSGLPGRSLVQLFTLNGISVANITADDSGGASIRSLSKGIYILKTQLSTIKVILK
ncbi:MAG: T9SS type A sorting domain-containing protein [Muribaculaceae bacterium]|nr:T9SS type A sorting domain-containing protein [Muribaculaceae bacterium]